MPSILSGLTPDGSRDERLRPASIASLHNPRNGSGVQMQFAVNIGTLANDGVTVYAANGPPAAA